MSFASPVYLLALLAVPVVVGLYVWHDRRSSRVADRFSSPALLPNVVDREPGRLRHVPPAVLFVALSAFLVAFARPQAQVSVPRENATIMIAVDTSRSMAATDLAPTRLEVAKKSIRDFLAKAPDSYRIGLISFASTARVVAPPTHDRTLVDDALDQLRIGQGTALGDAVARAVEVGQGAGRADPTDDPTPTTVLLISDGKEDGGTISAQQASQTARDRGVRVNTVALGTPDGVVKVPLAGGYTERVQVPTNPATLRSVAQTTGGRFFSVPAADRLQQVYDDLRSQVGKEKKWREVSVAFAGAGALMLLVGGALSASLFRRLP